METLRDTAFELGLPVRSLPSKVPCSRSALSAQAMRARGSRACAVGGAPPRRKQSNARVERRFVRPRLPRWFGVRRVVLVRRTRAIASLQVLLAALLAAHDLRAFWRRPAVAAVQ